MVADGGGGVSGRSDEVSGASHQLRMVGAQITLPGGRWNMLLIVPELCPTWEPWFPAPKDADICAIVGDQVDYVRLWC